MKNSEVLVRTENLILALMLLLGLALPFAAQSADGAERGRLLYVTHCVSCHAVEIHWREKKLVGNWSSLKMQVSRWQKNAGLGWSEDDIEQVSVYLNASYYHFPGTAGAGLSSRGNKQLSHVE